MVTKPRTSSDLVVVSLMTGGCAWFVLFFLALVQLKGG
jgi:hypothetical protein